MPDVICSVAGCGRRHNAHGYCHAHYYRWRKHGDPMVDIPVRDKRTGNMSPFEVFRLLMPEEPPEGECWPWRGLIDKRRSSGYGLIAYDGIQYRAHRVSYELHVGPIPDGMMILHHCDYRPCCHPRHLYVGTAAENAQDMVDRDRTTRGSTGLRGELSPRSKLTNQEAEEIRRRYIRGVTRQEDLAGEYGVTQTAVSRIIRGLGY